ncbi:uncharacterized protein DS421_10g300130 [Arachis hypogaea]|nr:uncharacterized protein DS421_10g300130 [Arachis hypogaea]
MLQGGRASGSGFEGAGMEKIMSKSSRRDKTEEYDDDLESGKRSAFFEEERVLVTRLAATNLSLIVSEGLRMRE